MLRPFRAGDMITAGGVTGDVIEIGIFAISLNTMDNLRVTVGIGKILSNNIVAPITGKCFLIPTQGDCRSLHRGWLAGAGAASGDAYPSKVTWVWPGHIRGPARTVV